MKYQAVQLTDKYVRVIDEAHIETHACEKSIISCNITEEIIVETFDRLPLPDNCRKIKRSWRHKADTVAREMSADGLQGYFLIIRQCRPIDRHYNSALLLIFQLSCL